MDRGRKWSESSGPGPVRPRGASLDESSASSGDPISRLTSLATTRPSELAPPATGPQPVSAAQPTRVQIKPEPMDLEDKPSCRYAGQGGSAMFNLPGPSGGDGTSDSVPVSPSSWPRHNLENTDVGSVSKLPSHLESKRNKKPPVSTPPSYPVGDRSGRSPTSMFGSPFPFSGHPISSATDISQQQGTISTVSATATLSSEGSLEGGERQQSLQQDTQQLAHPQTWQRPFPSGASSNVEGATRQRIALMYKQQLLYVMKRLNRLGIGNGQEAGATPLGAQPEHNILHSRLQPVQQVDQQGSNQGVRRSRRSEEHTQHTIDVGGVSQVGQQETSHGSDTQISGGSSTATSDQSQVKSPHIRGYFMEQPIICGRSIAQSPTGMSPLSGMFGIQAQPQRGGTVQSDTTIRQLLRRTNPPYLTPVHQLHHQQQRYLQQQQHHHQQQQQQKHHPHPQHFHKPLSQRLSDGSYSAKPATVGQRRYSAPPYTSDVVMKEESGDQFSNQSGSSAQLTDSTQAMESSGSEGMEPFPQKDLNHNIPTTSSNMMSMGEVCIVPPTPISDPDAVHLAEINMGSTLLDLDLLQQQQQRHGPSPSPSFGGGFGLPPSPDMQGSFYPEQHFFPQQPMGPTIQQAGGDQMSEIDENEMVRLLMREMIPDILADCHKLQLTPNLYFWSPEDVQKWLACVASRFELGEFEMGNFFMDGAMLATLQDTDFRQRAPKCGDILYSVVCLLKSSIHFDAAPQVVPQAVQQPPMFHHIPQPSPFNTGAPTTEMCMPPPVATPGDESGSTGSPSDDEVSIPSPAPSGPNTSMTPNHTGGIQLWQFLKELLLQPNSYSYCIRWMDRTQGIFKIEDSVEVARLWGLRKNRPAMNYDKLSRSIRQYYRKGIMKKTEVSQRLVYQFVHPC